MRRMSLKEASCPVARALDVIGDWWSLLIIRDVFDGLYRFGEIQANLGVSKGVLSTRLQALTERGVIERAPASDGTAYQEYTLTKKGRGLYLVIVALRQWGEAHLYERGEKHSVLVDKISNKRVAPLRLLSTDGRELSWGHDGDSKGFDLSVKTP
jgi:DNA-binding HxlR family transcriptional regulator